MRPLAHGALRAMRSSTKRGQLVRRYASFLEGYCGDVFAADTGSAHALSRFLLPLRGVDRPAIVPTAQIGVGLRFDLIADCMNRTVTHRHVERTAVGASKGVVLSFS